MSNQSFGKSGEDKAAAYLQNHGYTVLQRNFRIRNGEVDIIAIDRSGNEPVLAFIEVKTRQSNTFGTPFESITSWKLDALLRSARVYKSLHPKTPDLMRIDGVSVMFAKEEVMIELLKNISE